MVEKKKPQGRKGHKGAVRRTHAVLFLWHQRSQSALGQQVGRIPEIDVFFRFLDFSISVYRAIRKAKLLGNPPETGLSRNAASSIASGSSENAGTSHGEFCAAVDSPKLNTERLPRRLFPSA